MNVKEVEWILIEMQILFKDTKNSTLKLRECYYHTWIQHFYIRQKEMLGLRSWVRKDACDKLLIWEKLSSSDQNYNEDKE